MCLSKYGIQSERPELTGCPACGAPAEVIDRFVLQSTDGPVVHLKVRRVTGEWFTVPVPPPGRPPNSNSSTTSGWPNARAAAARRAN